MGRADFTYLSRLFAIFVIYFVTARLGLMVDAVGGFATLVWLPTGISLAALLILGVRYWPAIALGAFLANFTNGAPVFAALGISLGNTLEAVIGFHLLKRAGFDNSLKRLSDVLSLVLFAAAFSTLISATIGVTSLWLTGVINTANYFTTWSAWWIGDAVSNLIVATAILVVKSSRWNKVPLARGIEAVGFCIFAAFIGLLVFTNVFGADITSSPITYPVFLPIIWASLRFGQREAVLTVFSLSMLAVWGTIQFVGPFSNGTLSQNLILLQSYMIVASTTSMILASVIEERKILEKRKDEFISIASHELKTPVTSIKGYAELLDLRFRKTRDNKSADLVQKMDFQINKLISLINDLLDITKIESGKLILKNTYLDLNELLDEVVEEMQVTTNKHTIIKKFGKTRTIYADRERLEQVVVNVIGNAIKYSPKKGKIIVKTTTDNRTAKVSVQDFGIGIAQDMQSKIFERFFQEDGVSAKSGQSVGLGLYISAEIIRRLGGKIWVKSRKGGGSTFYFTLPVRRTEG